MNTSIHRGHVQLGEVQLGATLTLEPGRFTPEIASPSDAPDMPERIELICFTSNTDYFTLVNLFRKNLNVRSGVASLSTYTGGLAFESGYFCSLEEIRSRSW